MALTINTNLYALNAQRNLRKTESPLAQAMQRLSSTLRINSAKDDAAGLAISTRMTRQINGLTVAMRNANDGVSFAQTAEGAMDEMVTALQRIYELAEQASSYNSSLDRDSMNLEVSDLINELGRVVSQTRYNGDQFLNQAKSIDIQVGIEVNETINISTSNVSPTTMGVATSYTTSLNASNVAQAGYTAYNYASSSTAAVLDGVTLGDALAGSDYMNNSLGVINRINQYTSQTGVTAFGYGNSLVLSTNIVIAGTTTTVDAGYLTINGTQIGSFSAASGTSATVANMITAINAKSTTTGVTAVGINSAGAAVTDYTSQTRVVLANTTGAAISANMNTAVSGASALTNDVMASATMAVSAGQNGKIILNDAMTDLSLSMNSIAAVVTGYGSSTTSVTLTAKTINDVSVSNAANANIAILAVKEGLETLNSEKAKLGAKLNRLESTIRNLDNVRENISGARSRIMDADFAAETANMTKFMIMQQAGISVLSQANTIPQSVLALLGGR